MGISKRSMTSTDLINFGIFVLVLRLDLFQVLLILLNCFLLLFNSVSLCLQDFQLSTLAFNFLLTNFVFLLQLGNILITSAHDFSVVVKESGILDQTLLQLVVFFSELGFTRLELKLLLGEVFLFSYECLLILVHLAPLV